MLDENVSFELVRYLRGKVYNVSILPKGASDKKLALISIQEKRVLVTNDSDFTDPGLYTSSELYSLIWIRIPQVEKDLLTQSFQKFLSEYKQDYKGRFFLIDKLKWDVSNLAIKIDYKL